MSKTSTVPTSDPGGSDRLALQVVARPDQKPAPPIDSWPHLLQPKALHIRLMPLCDAACEFCETMAVAAGDKEKEVAFPPEAWERIKTAWLPDLQGIEVAGLGEPTLSKMWGTVATDTLAAGKVFYAPTNGHWLDKPFVYKPLGDGTNVRLSISLDAGDAETYVKIGRGKDEKQWTDTLAAIRTFQKKCPKAHLHSQFTATIQNIKSLKAWMEVCAGLGIKETIFRWAMCHTIAREDNSLRFARDLTEACIYDAQLVAEANGINFEVERRDYADGDLGNSLATGDQSPTTRLKRYLSLQPLSVIVCGGSTVTKSDNNKCTTIFGSTTTVINAISTSITTANTTIAGVTHLQAIEVDYHLNNNTDTIICGTMTCTRTTGFTQAWDTLGYVPYDGTTGGNFVGTGASNIDTRFATFSSVTDTCPGFGACNTVTGVPTAVVETDPVTFVGGNGTTSTNSTGATLVKETQVNTLNCSGVGASSCTRTTYLTTYILSYGTVSTTQTSTTIIDTCPGFGPMSEGYAEVVRSVIAPRGAGELAAMSVEPAFVPTKAIDASPVVWSDGSISSCFAKHLIGNIFTDTLDSLAKNPEYQNFLQTRQGANGGVQNNEWCFNCPRNL